LSSNLSEPFNIIATADFKELKSLLPEDLPIYPNPSTSLQRLTSESQAEQPLHDTISQIAPKWVCCSAWHRPLMRSKHCCEGIADPNN
jgi:hypothetical protein